MVHRTGGKRGGNIELERQITALGKTRKERRFRVSTMSRNPKVLRRANAALDDLIATEKWDLIRAWRRGDVRTPEILEARRKDRTGLILSNVKLQAYLWDRTTQQADKSETTEPGAVSRAFSKIKPGPNRKRYLDSFVALERKAAKMLPQDATVAMLLDVDWAELAGEWGGSGADWMHLRRALSRFATLWLADKYDPFARQLRQVVPTKRVKKRRPKLTIEQFIDVVNHTPAHAAVSYWVLVITGVRLGEYKRSTKAHLHKPTFTYHVPGTKTEGSDAVVQVSPRWWTYLEDGIPARLGVGWLRKYWKRACTAAGISGITLHDLRHCHAQWATNAGVPESKIQSSLRHESPGLTRDYTMQADTLDVSTALADRILGAPTPPRKRKKG